MDWSEIIAHLNASYVVLREGKEVAVIGWKVGPAIHTQNVDVVEAFGTPWLRIMSHAGPRTCMAAEDVVVHNMTLAIGALGARGESYVLRHLIPLATATRAQIDQALEVIAHEAARLRAEALVPRDRRSSPSACADPFAD